MQTQTVESTIVASTPVAKVSLEDMSKKQLEAMAKDLEIEGRSKMTKDELIQAIREEDEGLGFEEDEAAEVLSVEQLKELKKRRRSSNLRDSAGNVIRKGKNLSGNIPYRHKLYALREEYSDPKTWSQSFKDSLAVMPMQMQLIVKCMAHEQLPPMTGKEIVETAIAKHYLKTKIEPANLYAYYAKKFLGVGVYCVSDEEE